MPVFRNKVLLKHSHMHFLLSVLSCCNGRVEQCYIDCMADKLKICTICPFITNYNMAYRKLLVIIRTRKYSYDKSVLSEAIIILSLVGKDYINHLTLQVLQAFSHSDSPYLLLCYSAVFFCSAYQCTVVNIITTQFTYTKCLLLSVSHCSYAREAFLSILSKDFCHIYWYFQVPGTHSSSQYEINLPSY